ncbi:DUF1489 family protein [Aquisediminimonas profunda]|uniref:DUF1489 family protein n=1 Tax=Aquisediminimonas profunda TaxID=1550733 RepID=UPI001C6270CC|nr:DUF1489 domain-containing protein [Aquisediminimonas profunda]
MLHITRIAFACDSFATLADRMTSRATEGKVRLTTRYRPKRHEELVGGSLYWILKHRLVARSEILGFEDAEGGRTYIVLSDKLVPVVPVPRRAHQGWRYLAAVDAPPDFGDTTSSGEALPPELTEQLAEIGLF